MSDGPIPLLGPDDLKFVPEPSDFAGLVGNELGTLGTNQDGFDALFNDAAALASGAGAVLESFDQELADASFQLPEFDPSVPTNLMASLQPASDAADTALADYNVQVPPDPTGGTSGNPPGGKPQDCTPPAGATTRSLGQLKQGSAHKDVFMGTGDTASKYDTVPSVSLNCAEGNVFKIYEKVTRVGYGGNVGPVDQHDLYLRVTPTTPGTYRCVVSVQAAREPGQQIPPQVLSYYSVEITQ
jgi:hypothetical protein